MIIDIKLTVLPAPDESVESVMERWQRQGLTRKIADLVESTLVVTKIVVDTPNRLTTDERLANAIWGGFDKAPGNTSYGCAQPHGTLACYQWDAPKLPRDEWCTWCKANHDKPGT